MDHSAERIAQHSSLDAFAAHRRALTSEVDALRTERSALLAEFKEVPASHPARIVLDRRMIELDARIQISEQILTRTTDDFVEVATLPGSLVPPIGLMHIPNEYVMLGSLFMLVAVLPLSLALARRLWKRGAAPVATLPAELIERLHRMESSVESTALEVERIGEGQRFLTRLMSDHLSALGEGSPRGGFLERAKERASHSGTTPH